MDKQSILKATRSFKNSLVKHSPEIMVGIGIAGMISATIMAVKATPKAIRLIDEKKEELKVDKLASMDVIKTTWKCYLPTVLVSGGSIMCLIFASSVNLKRNTALATAYSLSESALQTYQQKVVEVIGEKKEQSVRDSIAQSKIKSSPVSYQEVVIVEKGNTLCYESFTGRYFKSDIERIKKKVNDLNRTMRTDMYISLNDFYYELGLSPVKIGEFVGWNIEKGYIDLNYSSQLTDDGNPCLVIDFNERPVYDFDKY